MKITTRHPASNYGVPVILNDQGEVLDTVSGFCRVLAILDWTVARAAEKFGMSESSVASMRIGRKPIGAAQLNVLADELALVQK